MIPIFILFIKLKIKNFVVHCFLYINLFINSLNVTIIDPLIIFHSPVCAGVVERILAKKNLALNLVYLY